MPIKEYEFYHGAVLTKILRKDIPTNLKLVEANPKELWSAYRINDQVVFYMKSSTAPQLIKSGLRWQFPFTLSHINEIKLLLEQANVIYFALICINEKYDGYGSEVCLLDKDQMLKLILLDSINPQSITVYSEKNKQLKVHGTLSQHKKELNINRNLLDRLVLPAL